MASGGKSALAEKDAEAMEKGRVSTPAKDTIGAISMLRAWRTWLCFLRFTMCSRKRSRILSLTTPGRRRRENTQGPQKRLTGGQSEVGSC
jgi:hypothetical protein